MKTLYENEMTNVNIPDHKMEKKNLSAEEMRQVSGGAGMGRATALPLTIF